MSLTPATLARSVLIAVLAIVAAPVLAMVGVLLLGLLVPASAGATPVGALAQATGINAVLYGSAGFTVLAGVLAVALLHADAHTARQRPVRAALGGAMRTLPRLLGALLVLLVVAVAALVAWLPLAAAAIVLAVVLLARYRRRTTLAERPARTSPGVRRALFWAIPFLPLLAALAALVALLPASLARPRTIWALLRTAVDRVRTQKRSLLVLLAVVAPVSAVLTWAATTVATAVQGGATDATSGGFIGGTLILAGSLGLLLVLIGSSVAVASPPAPSNQADAAAPAPRIGSRFPYADFLRRATPALRRTAMVAVFALCATFVSTPAPASAVAGTVTEMAVYEQNASSATLGTNLTFNVVMTSSGVSTSVTGTVDVYSGATLLTTVGTDYLGWVTVPSTGLAPGTVPLRFEYVPTGVFIGSEATVNVELGKANTRITSLTATPHWGSTITWGDTHQIVATVTSDLDGPRSLVLREGYAQNMPIVASVDFTITNGTANVTLDLTGRLGFGAKQLWPQVLETDTGHGAGYDVWEVTVDRAPTTVALTNSAATVGGPVTLTATASSSAANAAVVAGQMKFFVNGNDLGTVAVDSNGQARIRYTPTTVNNFVVRADFSQVAAPYTHVASSSGNVTVSVARANAPWPTAQWTGARTVEDTGLVISYAATAGLPAPTGWVQIVDSRYVPVGRGYLNNGSLTMPIAAVGGERNYYAIYEGDGVYLGRQTSLPVVAVEAYVPALTVTMPTEPRIGKTLTLGVTLVDVPVNVVKNVTVYDYVNGDRSSLGTITLNSAGTGTLAWSTLVAGSHPLVVEVDYTAASGLATTVSPRRVSTVLPAEVPDLRVTTTTAASSLRAGAPVNLVVTAHTLGSGTTALAAGTRATIVDAAGRGLGTVTLVAGTGGLTGSLTVSTLRGGLAQLHARASYGPLDQTVTGPVFDLTLAAPETYLSVSSEAVVAGRPATLTVTAAVPYGLPGESTRVGATVAVNGADYPFNLWRSNGTDAFIGTVVVPTTSAGNLAVTASITGDGIDTGPARRTTMIYVSKRPTLVYLPPVYGAAAGHDLTVTPQVTAHGFLVSDRSSGLVGLTLAPSGAQCFAAPNTACTFAAGAVRVGENTIVATFFGDGDNLPSESSVGTFRASARYTDLAVTLSPTPDRWIEGESVTVTWKTTTSGTRASGLVSANIGENRCSGPALAGSCVIAVPERAWGAVDRYQSYSVAFTPFDDAPAREQTGGAMTRACVSAVAHQSTLNFTGATACQKGSRSGILTGSLVTITADKPAHNYALERWHLEGAGIVSSSLRDTVLTLRVTGSVSAWPVTRYAPTCFTLTLAPVAATPYAPGRLISFTKPNCASPNEATESELREQAAGTPRYANGTVVELYAEHNTQNRGATSWERPALDLLAFEGAEREVANPRFASVVMDQDRTVTARFKVRDCIAVSMVNGSGGTVAVQSSSRPDSTAHFAPYSGVCTDASGAAGYVPGTELTLRATASTGMFLSSFSEADNNCSWEASGRCVLFDPTFAVRAIGSAPAPAVSRLQVVTVQKPARYGAIFSEIRCVAVTTTTASPIGKTLDGEKVNSTSVTLIDQSNSLQSGCGGNRSTSSSATVGAFSTTTRTDWVVARGIVGTDATPDAIYFGRNGFSKVTWTTSSKAGVTRAGAPGSTSGPTLDLTKVGGSITIAANWYSGHCRVPVALPQGGSVRVTSATEEPYCPEGQLSLEQSGYVDADYALNAPNLMPYFSVETYDGQDPRLIPAADGRSYVQGQLEIPDANRLRFYSPRLEYCANLGLSVSEHDDSGNSKWMGLAQKNAVVADDGGCPPGWARPGRTVGIGLTNLGRYSYSLVNGTTSTGASVSLNAQGDITSRVGLPLQLKVICYTVTVGDRVSLTSPGNCPGGANNRFVKGSVAQVKVSPNEGTTFRSWKDVAQSKGSSAWVIMSEDRAPWADISTPGNLEMTVNVASNLAQRGLSLLVTFGTGVLMAEMYIVQGLALGLQGVSTALHAMGVEGKVLDGFDEGVAIISSQIQMVSMLSNCMKSWSSGAALTELPIDERLADGANLTADQITDRLEESLETALTNRGFTGAAAMTGGIGQARDVVDIFGSNLNMLGRGAAVGWNNLADEVGGCMVDGMKNAGWR
jgi:hypothetical protein